MSASPLEYADFIHADSAAFAVTLKGLLGAPDRNRPVGLILCEPDGVHPEAIAEELSRVLGPELHDEDLRFIINDEVIAIVRDPVRAPAETEGLSRLVHGSLVEWAADQPTDLTFSTGMAVTLGEDTAADLMIHADHALCEARVLGPNALVMFDDEDRLAPETDDRWD